MCIVFFTDSWGKAVSASLALTVFVKTLTFAAAVKVTSEHWVLLDLDRGVLNHSELLLFKSKREREDVREWAEFKGRQKYRDSDRYINQE